MKNMTQKEKIQMFTLGLLVLIGILFWVTRKTSSTPPPTVQPTPTSEQNSTQAATSSTDLPGLRTGPLPWDTGVDHLKDRLASIGLPALSAEGTALHIHQHLDMTINGQSVAIPPHIGINETAGFISSIHIHDTTGIIHVESPTIQTFTLGQFFDIWGVRFSRACIGGYCTSSTNVLHVYVNAIQYTGNPRDIVLAPHQEIFVYYGPQDELPKTIPSSYNFPAGY
jgi:hypothetical protein